MLEKLVGTHIDLSDAASQPVSTDPLFLNWLCSHAITPAKNNLSLQLLLILLQVFTSSLSRGMPSCLQGLG